MKTKFLIVPALALFVLSSCTPGLPGEQTSSIKKTSTSTTVVDTFKASATVTAIDASTRKIKLTLSDGRRTTVKCGPDVRNFSQIHIGDRVNVTVTEQIAAYLDKGKTPDASGSSTVALAPLGTKPGVIVADTVQGTVKITAIDTATRKVTFLNKDGESNTLKAGDHIDLTKFKAGDTVTVRKTEAVAVTVEKP